MPAPANTPGMRHRTDRVGEGFCQRRCDRRHRGSDCIFIGPADFAASLGHLGNTGHADVEAAITYITAVCLQYGKAVGIYAHHVNDAKRYRNMEMHFIALNSDVVWLTHAARQAMEEMK